MAFQYREGDGLGDVVLIEFSDDGCFVLASGDQQYLLGVHDVLHAHGDGRCRHYRVFSKKAAIVYTGLFRQLDHMATTVECGTGFVKTYMPVTPYPQQLQFYAAVL